MVIIHSREHVYEFRFVCGTAKPVSPLLLLMVTSGWRSEESVYIDLIHRSESKDLFRFVHCYIMPVGGASDVPIPIVLIRATKPFFFSFFFYNLLTKPIILIYKKKKILI